MFAIKTSENIKVILCKNHIINKHNAEATCSLQNYSSYPTNNKWGNNVENLLVWMFQIFLLKTEALLYEIVAEAIFKEEFSYTFLP